MSNKMAYFKRKNIVSSYILIILTLIFLSVVAISFGAANITALDTFKIILSQIPIINNFIDISQIPQTSFTIVLRVRLPRVLLGGLIGMNLSVVGATYQGIFKNPMADPYILGISSGAALGSALSIVFGLNNNAILAFVAALLTTYLVYSIASVGNKAPTVNLLLSGVAVSFFLSSIISLLMVLFTKEIDKIVFWSLGSLTSANWNKLILVFALSIPMVLVIIAYCRELNIISTGEEYAKNLGVNTERTKKILLIVSSLLIATSVSFTGIIGFVGLIVPHSVRILYGADHKKLIPLSALYGMAFIIICDTLARTIIAPTEIPIGAITSFFGAPYFIYLLYKNKKKVM